MVPILVSLCRTWFLDGILSLSTSLMESLELNKVIEIWLGSKEHSRLTVPGNRDINVYLLWFKLTTASPDKLHLVQIQVWVIDSQNTHIFVVWAVASCILGQRSFQKLSVCCCSFSMLSSLFQYNLQEFWILVLLSNSVEKKWRLGVVVHAC